MSSVLGSNRDQSGLVAELRRLLISEVVALEGAEVFWPGSNLLLRGRDVVTVAGAVDTGREPVDQVCDVFELGIAQFSVERNRELRGFSGTGFGGFKTAVRAVEFGLIDTRVLLIAERDGDSVALIGGECE